MADQDMTKEGVNTVSKRNWKNARVLVRAYRGRAVPMLCVGTAAGRIEVARAGQMESISLPSEDVFEYSSDIEGNVMEAIKSGDEIALRRAWASAQLFEDTLVS